MIRVIITGPPTTNKERSPQFPYRIEGQSASHGIPIGLQWSSEPLLDACRILAQMGEPKDHLVGLYDLDRYTAEPDWRMRTTVGYGSRYTVRENREKGPEQVKYKASPYGSVSPGMRSEEEGGTSDPLDAGVPTEDDMGKYREFPGGPIKETPEPGGLIKDTDPYNAEQPRATSAPPATPAAPPPPPHKPPAHPAGKHPAHAKPAKSEKSHHSPKPKGSGGRRGRSLAR